MGSTCARDVSLVAYPGYQRDILLVLEEQLQVDLEHRLEQPHVCTLVQADLVLPDVHNQDLARREGKQRALPLKILVLAALAAVGALDVHDQDVVRDSDCVVALAALLPLVLGEPYPLGRLPPLGLGHYGELGAEEHVEQGRLAGRLRPEDGDEVVVEARIDDVGLLEVRVEVRAAGREVSLLGPGVAGGCGKGVAHLKDLSSSMTWTPCSYFCALGSSPTAAKWPFMVTGCGNEKERGEAVYRGIGNARWLKRAWLVSVGLDPWAAVGGVSCENSMPGVRNEADNALGLDVVTKVVL